MTSAFELRISWPRCTWLVLAVEGTWWLLLKFLRTDCGLNKIDLIRGRDVIEGRPVESRA